MRYVLVAFGIMLFVVIYVWQNIEMMKLQFEYREAVKKGYEIVKMNDKLQCQIERYRRMEVVEAYARERGMRPIAYTDIIVLRDKKEKANAR